MTVLRLHNDDHIDEIDFQKLGDKSIIKIKFVMLVCYYINIYLNNPSWLYIKWCKYLLDDDDDDNSNSNLIIFSGERRPIHHSWHHARTSR